MNHTPAQLGRIFAPEQSGVLTRGDLTSYTKGCQRVIDHYCVSGAYMSPALTLALVCKALIEEVGELRRRLDECAPDDPAPE